jgi:dTDP-4-amino-4,6-dideoxygalactose transaminase
MCNSNYHVSSLEYYRQLIRAEIADVEDADLETIGSIASRFPDVHIASSCMQKALRRGDRVYAHYPSVPIPVSEKICKTVVTLPMHPYLDAATQDRIIETVLESVARTRAAIFGGLA